MIIHENAEGDRKEIRSIEIKIVLLGAYHNGNLEITYKNVKGYSLSKSHLGLQESHGDWMRDEIRLSENGLVLHEIEWLLEPNWIIECEDIEFQWKPFSYEKAMNQLEKDNYNKIRNGGVGFYPNKRGLIAVWGKEAVQFLNGLITNDVAKLEDGAQMLAAFPNAQGRLLAVVRVLRDGDRFLFETEDVTREKVYNNLFRFTFAGDFFVEDLSEKYSYFSIPNFKFQIPNSEAIYFGKDVFIPQDTKFDVSDAVQISDEVYEILRIEQGIPLYGVDMDETTIVPELGLDGLISYQKGCYIGQEIIARIYFRGHVAKQLRGLVLSGEGRGTRGEGRKVQTLELKSMDSKNAGRVTSVCYSPKLGKYIALGYVRYDYLAEGTELKIGDDMAIVKDLPFVS